MLDFNLYYAEKTAERRLEEVERTARTRQALGEPAPVRGVPAEPSRLPDCRGTEAMHGAPRRAVT